MIHARRSPALALVALALAPGCALLDRVSLDDYPLTTGVFAVTGVVSGAPVTVACLPVTLLVREDWAPLVPGIVVGVPVGVVCAAPVFLLETVLFALPGRLARDAAVGPPAPPPPPPLCTVCWERRPSCLCSWPAAAPPDARQAALWGESRLCACPRAIWTSWRPDEPCTWCGGVKR